MNRVLMVTSEATPYAKTGGLADVLGALPAALARQDVETAVILPRYRAIPLAGTTRVYSDAVALLGGSVFRFDLYRTERDGVPFYFVDCPPAYDRAGIYNEHNRDYPDNDARFALLCKAALLLSRQIWRPEIVHCHDWQAALLPVYLRTLYTADPSFLGIRTVLTIHNLGYQGVFGPESATRAGLPFSTFRSGLVEFDGLLNLLKGAIVTSDAITTVSPRYAQEIQTPEYGFGLDGLLRQRAEDLTGILNGVDYQQWSPESDRHLAAPYSARDLAGKRVCKQELLREVGLPETRLDRPLIGIVSRLAGQKGFDLIAQIAGELLQDDVSLVVLGSGEPQYERFFQDLAWHHHTQVAVRIGYDNALSHRIEAGSDLFLMPSRYEPCGLNQIYSLRYGTIPVVRATGGLDDTIKEGTGFKFRDYTGSALLRSIREALAAYQDTAGWQRRMRRAMQEDFSWDASAAEYRALYQRVLSRQPSGLNLNQRVPHQMVSESNTWQVTIP